MNSDEHVEALLQKLAEVCNLAAEINVDLKPEVNAAGKKVLERSVELDEQDVLMILHSYSQTETVQ